MMIEAAAGPGRVWINREVEERLLPCMRNHLDEASVAQSLNGGAV